MAVLTVHSLVFNIANAASSQSLEILLLEFKRASDLMVDPNMSLSPLVGTSFDHRNRNEALSPACEEFIHNFAFFLRLKIQYWDPSTTSRARFFRFLEDRYSSLLTCKPISGFVDPVFELMQTAIYSQLPKYRTRPWPTRFVSQNACEDEYAPFYLIGISLVPELDDDSADLPQDEALHALNTIGDEFCETLRTDKRFDLAVSWVGFSLVRRDQLNEAKVDTREWGFVADMEKPDAVDDDDEENEDDFPPSKGRSDSPSWRQPRHGKGKATAPPDAQGLAKNLKAPRSVR